MYSKLKSALFAKPATKKKDRSRNLEVDGEFLPVEVVENARAHRLTLRIVPGGRGLKVTIPPHVGEEELNEFLERNRNWAASRLARMPDTTKIEEGAMIPFKGVDHKIIHLDRLRGVVEAKLIVGEPSLLVPGDPGMIPRKMISFLKKEARKELNLAVGECSEALGARAKIIRITDTTSRWGSCSTTRTLSFSWRIIMAPPEVLYYLAAHEVAHLLQMNHSEDFWNLVRETCPDMDRHKAWLKTNGNHLHAISFD